MTAPVGLHIGTEDAIVLTWDGASVANTLNFEANFGFPAGKDVACLATADNLFVGVTGVAELWRHNGAAWSRIVDATDTNLNTVWEAVIHDHEVICCVSDTFMGTAAAGTQIWAWDYIAAPAAPTAPLYTIPAPFLGGTMVNYKESYLVCAGLDRTNIVPEVHFSRDHGRSWSSAGFPALFHGYIGSMSEHSDGYLYVVCTYGGTFPYTSSMVLRTADLQTWEKVHTIPGYWARRSIASFNGELFIGLVKATGATETRYTRYDGTSWTDATADATARTPTGFAWFTDSADSDPLLWMAASDDLLYWDGTSWTVADVGATTSYASLSGAFAPEEWPPIWDLPASGSGADGTTTMSVEARGLLPDIRIYRDVVLDTSNWDLHYSLSPTTNRTKITFRRPAGFGTSMVKIDIYATPSPPKWAVRRIGLFTPTAAGVESSIRKGDTVKCLLDGKLYFVDASKLVSTVRYVYLVGSGAYHEQWVLASYVVRPTTSGAASADILALGIPASTPP